MNARLLLVDDHEVFLEGLTSLLVSEPDLTPVRRVTNGLAVLQAVRETEPDLVVLDLALPGLNGVEVTRQITTERPDIPVLCLSMHSAAHFVEEALDAGASGYVLKEDAFEEVVRAIRAVLAGRMFLCAGVAGTVVRGWRSLRVAPEGSAYTVLTNREREVLQLLSEGLSNKEIAGRLHVSVKTVSTHREHIMKNTEIHTVAGLTKYAIAEGLTQVEASAGSRVGPDPGSGSRPAQRSGRRKSAP